MFSRIKGISRSGSGNWKVLVAVCVVFVAVGIVVGLLVAERKAEALRSSQEIARLKVEQENLKAEAEKARAEAERAKAEVELARTRLKEEEEAKAAEKARADSLAQAAEKSDRGDAAGGRDVVAQRRIRGGEIRRFAGMVAHGGAGEISAGRGSGGFHSRGGCID